MKFWSVCLTVILHLAHLGSAWDEKSNGLVLNKIGNEFFFPHLVKQTEDGSHVIFKDPNETSIETYLFCNSKKENSEEYTLTGELLSDQNAAVSPLCPGQEKPIQPVQELIKDDSTEIPCGTQEEQDKGKYHRVYYKLYERGQEHHMILYEYCFDDKMKEMVFVKFTIDHPQLLQNKLLKEEQNQQLSYFALEDSSVELKYKQNSYNSARMVGVPEFMPFALARKPFHLYDSSASLNQELYKFWNEFLLNVKEKISKKNEPIRVLSGVYDRKRVHGASKYLTSETAKYPSPYAFWVLLYNYENSEGVSLIMHNHAFDKYEQRQKQLCDDSVCSEAGLGDIFPNSREFHYVMAYCCRASTITNLYHGFNDPGKLLKF